MKRFVLSFVLALTLAACGSATTDVGNIADATNAAADTEDPAPDEGGASAEPDADDKDMGTPGPGADAGKADECQSDEDCTAPVECANAACVPLPEGNKCMVFAKLAPENFCDDANPCTVDVCNTEPNTAKDLENYGCAHKPRPCDDSNPCTLNLCDANAPDGCVFTTDVNACNDNNACTQDSCLPGGNCEHVPVTCDDGIASTEDGCTAAGGCFNNPSECAGDAQCGDNDPCTVDFCNADQVCIHQPMICDDGIACTNDLCFGGACMAISNCLGGDACNESACNILSGNCEPLFVEKPDGKECTADVCDPASGWAYHKVEGCCVKDSDCELGDACIVPVCDTTLNVCASVAKLVDDGIACTVDSCELGGYIQNKADDDLCAAINPTKPHCSNELGCVECSAYGHCDDKDPCTDDLCEWKTGTCSNKTKCTAPEVCVVSSSYTNCDKPQGWCEADNECPHKTCQSATCVDNSCEYAPLNCDDDEPCTTDFCTTSWGCEHKWKNCDDNDVCTDNDSCNPKTGECEHLKNAFCIACDAPEECPTGSQCFGNSIVNYSGVCHQGQCFHDYPETCNSTACYVGTCENGACLQKIKNCSDSDACTKDLCSYDTGCYSLTIDCNDYNPCTVDSCDPDKTCVEGVDFCDPNNGCSNKWDYDGCPWGPEGNPCGDLWDCAPCKYAGCTDYPETGDLCIGAPNYVCVHGVTGLYGGIGIKNMGTVDVVLDLKPNNGSPTLNLLLAAGDHLYYLDATSVEIYSVMDGKNNDDLGFPAGLPCIDTNGNLTIGKVVNNILVCD